MIRWVLNIIVLLLLLRLAMRFVMGLLRGLSEPSAAASSPGRRPAGGPARIAGELVKDPVCATYIPRESAIEARVSGETRYYCSVTCRDKDAAGGHVQPHIGRTAHG